MPVQPRSSRILSVVLAVLCLLVTPIASTAQWPPRSLTNVQVLPADMPIGELVTLMAGFTRALGVRCSTCHVGEETADLSTYDFASDEKDLKRKAREMLRMVREINDRHLVAVPARVDPPLRVECVTCHHGVRVPRTLQSELLNSYGSGGLDALEARYRQLRQQYYGRAAYDFGDVPLADVGTELQRRGSLGDAEAVHALNVESNPGAWFAQLQHASVALVEAFSESGVEGGVALYRELSARYDSRAFPEPMVNQVGYTLLGANRVPEAVAVFRLNVEAHAQSWNAHDSMGEGYQRAGQRELAIQSYRRSLELNPQNENARVKLRALGATVPPPTPR